MAFPAAPSTAKVPRRPRRFTAIRWQLSAPLLFLGVYAAYAIGSQTAIWSIEASGLAAVLFAPAGITVATLLRVPRGQWPVVLSAAAAAECTMDLLHGTWGMLTVGGYVLANVAEPLVGATLTRRWVGDVDLARRRHVFAFLIGAVLTGPAVGAVIGSVVSALGERDVLWSTMWQWWLGDAAGAALVGMGILAWGSSPSRRSLGWRWATCLLLLSAAASLASGFWDLPLGFLVLIVTVGAGALFGTRAVALSALSIATAAAVSLGVDPEGALLGVDHSAALVLLRTELMVFAFTGLFVAAESHELELTTRDAQRLEAQAMLDQREADMLARLNAALHERRRRAELLANVLAELETLRRVPDQLQRLTELLVPALGDYAAVEEAGGTNILAAAHRATPANEARARVRQELSGAPAPVRVPIPVGDGQVGTLAVGVAVPELPAHFRSHERDFAEFLRDAAERIGVIITETDLRRGEHLVSLRLQRALLPDSIRWLPSLPVQALYHAADEQLEVGGDWYDTFLLGQGRLAVVVGDVVGHSIESAIAMGRIRIATAALVEDAPARPGALLDALERCALAPGGADFTTAAVAVADPDTGELRYSSAGHPPIVVAEPGQPAVTLEGGRSAALCQPGNRPKQEAVVHLAPGSVVILYSDGLVERRGEPIDDGIARLARAAERLVLQPLDELPEALLHAVGGDHGFDDDVVIACFRFAPPIARFEHELPAIADSLAPLRLAARAWLSERGISADDQGKIVLALGEACTNSIEHGHRNGDEGTVRVIVDDHRFHVAISVVDEGAWKVPQDLRRHWGTAVMERLSCNFRREVTESGTAVHCVVPVNAASRGGRQPCYDLRS